MFDLIRSQKTRKNACSVLFGDCMLWFLHYDYGCWSKDRIGGVASYTEAKVVFSGSFFIQTLVMPNMMQQRSSLMVILDPSLQINWNSQLVTDMQSSLAASVVYPDRMTTVFFVTSRSSVAEEVHQYWSNISGYLCSNGFRVMISSTVLNHLKLWENYWCFWINCCTDNDRDGDSYGVSSVVTVSAVSARFYPCHNCNTIVFICWHSFYSSFSC